MPFSIFGQARTCRAGAAAPLVAALALMLTGCVETRTTHHPWDVLRDMAGKPDSAWEKSDKSSPNSKAASATPNEAGVYSIELKVFEGEHASIQAQTLAADLAGAGMTEVWVLPSAEKATVYRGTYMSNGSPRAQSDLEETRKFHSGGDKPFVAAALVQPDKLTPRAIDPWDLKQYVGMYSLQIGYYDEQFGPNFREAAVEAVKVLRAQGEQAFYHHGPFLSEVTLDLFIKPDDWVTVNGVEDYGPRIRALQKRFPHHMHNGLAVMLPVPGQAELMFQETGIVGPVD